MFPAMKDGDLIIAYRLQQDYAKNDVVVYEVDGEQRVGRVVAREGDMVEINKNGQLIVNTTNQAGDILYPTYPREAESYSEQVPRGEVFILGDYRTNSYDSRDHGTVSVNNVMGKIITILRRRGL